MTSPSIPLEIDLPGRVGNMRLAPQKALNAVYEAIVNSIHSVLERQDAGTVRLEVHRGPGTTTLDGSTLPGRVEGFTVTDDGRGFDEDNFTSFRRSDSTTKANLGGKGVGRLLWLRVFKRVAIDSVFDDGTQRRRRTFTFTLKGIEGHDVSPTTEPIRTVVTLREPTDRYRSALHHEAETLAVGLIEHCLEYFIAARKPRLLFSDAAAGFEADLVKMFQKDLKTEAKHENFTYAGQTFRIAHLLVRGRKNSKHAIHFCAHSRRVQDEILASRLAGLQGGIRRPESEDLLAYQGYVSGTLLDNLVDAERTGFDFEGLFSPGSDAAEDGGPTYDGLLTAAVSQSRDFLRPILDPILDENMKRISRLVETSLPQYRHVLKYKPDDVRAIPPNADSGEIDLHLYKIDQAFDRETRAKLKAELASTGAPGESPDARFGRLSDLLEKINESGMAKLARHVAYRRAVIEFMEEQLTLTTNGKYTLEEAVHAAVVPLKASSDDVPASRMNLWLLDDRLYFHMYLSSDLPFTQLAEVVARDSEDRPDIAVFQRSMAFADSLDQIGSVVIVEFKRPMRGDYATMSDDKDPVAQVLNYVETLREGKARGPKGQAVTIGRNVPFFAYIVADVTPSLKKLLGHHDFLELPEADGFVKMHQGANCHIEVISYRKMIRDAKKRNQAFFHKLGIPMA